MQLQTAAASSGLVINTIKTKYMRSKEIIEAANVDIKLNGQIYEHGTLRAIKVWEPLDYSFF
jgi:hypothetical protein